MQIIRNNPGCGGNVFKLFGIEIIILRIKLLPPVEKNFFMLLTIEIIQCFRSYSANIFIALNDTERKNYILHTNNIIQSRSWFINY